MKKDVDLHIRTRIYSETLQPKGETFMRELELEDSIEILTEGTMYDKNDALYISYDESEETGLSNVKTLLKLTDGSVRIRRYSENELENMDMELAPGVMSITRFKMGPMMSLDLEVYTNSLDSNLDEEGYGRISVDYKIKFDKFLNRRNKLDIEVKKVN